MHGGRDPIERAAGDDEDLQEVATWEPRTRLDRLAAWFYDGLLPVARGALVLAALAFTLLILVASSFGTPRLPIVGLFALASVIPALALAGYVYVVDITTREPFELLAVTFALSFVFASFAAIVNTAAEGVFFAFGGLGAIAYFLLIVAPGEEFVKLLAVRFYAYRDARFDAVVDGAVYGAVAGLGFATIENAIYVSGFVQTATTGSVVDQALDIAQRRALAGPGHVIYSAIAGYYLGLAKFNDRHRGALVVKGLLVAALLHAAYNVSVSIVPVVLENTFGVNRIVAFVAFVVVFDGLAGGYLFVKLRRYRRAYVASGAGNQFDPSTPVDTTEFEPGRREPAIGNDTHRGETDREDTDREETDREDTDRGWSWGKTDASTERSPDAAETGDVVDDARDTGHSRVNEPRTDTTPADDDTARTDSTAAGDDDDEDGDDGQSW